MANDQSDGINKKLAELNNQLLGHVAELQARIRAARACTSSSTCPLCTPDAKCEPHRQIDELSENALALRVTDLENRLMALEAAQHDAERRASLSENDCFDARAALKALRDEVPNMLRTAAIEAAAKLPEFEQRHREHIEFVSRLAKRLGVHPDVPLGLLQTMLEDAIRKLVS